MKRRDLERHLRGQGARLLREGGRHSYWGFDQERSTAVPRHREIQWQLARDICKQLGVPARASSPGVEKAGNDTGEYRETERSSLIALGPADLAAAIDWP